MAYFDVRKDEEGRENNQGIREEMERLIEGNEKEGVIVLGDFNGHLEELDGKKGRYERENDTELGRGI